MKIYKTIFVLSLLLCSCSNREEIKSVTNFELISSQNLINTYRISFSDGTYFDFSVKDGENGATGLKGDKGDKGENGATGLKGDKGDKGENGATGLKGDKGDKGEQGIKGQDGNDGIDGVNGLSAYDLYLKYNSKYLGNEEDFLNDLINNKLSSQITIKFDTDGGTPIYDIKTPMRSKLSSEVYTVKENCFFGGWSLDNEIVYLDDYIFDKGVTLKAVWGCASGDYSYVVLEDQTLNLTSYNGESTSINIPVSIDNKKVSKISENLFKKGNSISYLFIPNCEIEFSPSCFINLENLEILEMPCRTGLKLTTLFGDEENLPNNLLIKLSAPESPYPLQSIETMDFYIKYATKPNVLFNNINNKNYQIEMVGNSLKIKNYGDYDFSGCKTMTSFKMSCCYIVEYEDFNEQYQKINYVSCLTDRCFSGCTQLKTFIFDDNTNSIGEKAFNECISLEEIKLPSKLQYLRSKAFCGCISLKNVRIYSPLKACRSSAFENCPIEHIYFDGNEGSFAEEILPHESIKFPLDKIIYKN